MTTFLPTVHELSIVGVFDAGVPNRERLVLRPTEVTNLANFMVVLGIRNPDGTAFPLGEHTFWLGEKTIAPPSWIFLYTGSGQAQDTVLPESKEPAYVFHWGKPVTLFSNDKIVPMIFRLGGVAVGLPAHPTGQVPQRKPGLLR